MCAKRRDFDKRIAHLRELEAGLLDPITLNGIASLVAELEAKKAELHPGE